MFTAQDIAKLRAMTGAGMMDCKKALTESNGDMDGAVKFLREKGMAAAAKKADRIAAEGVVGSYIHMGGKIGVLVEVNCETDFVAKSEQFQQLVKDIAMQIAAAKPLYVNSSEVPAEVLESEKEILRTQALNEGKPAQIVEKMVEGRIKKYYQDFCLMDQQFVKNPDIKVSQLLKEKDAEVVEFARFEKGEGIEKKEENFAEEVMKQLQ